MQAVPHEAQPAFILSYFIHKKNVTKNQIVRIYYVWTLNAG